MAILSYIFLIALNILLAYSNNKVRLKRIKEKNYKQIEHFWYALVYTVLCLGLSGGYRINPYHFVSFLLLHLSIFPCAYNVFYGNPVFYLSKTSEALTDRVMVKIGLKDTKGVNLTALIISFLLLWL